MFAIPQSLPTKELCDESATTLRRGARSAASSRLPELPRLHRPTQLGWRQRSSVLPGLAGYHRELSSVLDDMGIARAAGDHPVACMRSYVVCAQFCLPLGLGGARDASGDIECPPAACRSIILPCVLSR